MINYHLPDPNFRFTELPIDGDSYSYQLIRKSNV